ncbi:YraN family protein [Phaeocystidibacter luteus]|uniref:UPF0102 protein F8C67_05620 n=1 Tax=Phaeocystidibacter luteus TaxID=911197 RepID=A0A6N6RJA2_9FLAO|nr:YraN family protein [Phaeocystidibacter luteus]KAB2813641.1 YraN family protein [Phaeocystidibacter luteus]
MDTMHNKRKGAEGEQAAVDYLVGIGYRIIGRNLQLGRDEIDILAKFRSTLIFVEVKTRATNTYSVPEDFITPQKEACMLRAADRYIQDHDWNGDTRFDLVAVYYAGPKPQVIHIQDAFYPRA